MRKRCFGFFLLLSLLVITGLPAGGCPASPAGKVGPDPQVYPKSIDLPNVLDYNFALIQRPDSEGLFVCLGYICSHVCDIEALIHLSASEGVIMFGVYWGAENGRARSSGGAIEVDLQMRDGTKKTERLEKPVGISDRRIRLLDGRPQNFLIVGRLDPKAPRPAAQRARATFEYPVPCLRDYVIKDPQKRYKESSIKEELLSRLDEIVSTKRESTTLNRFILFEE